MVYAYCGVAEGVMSNEAARRPVAVQTGADAIPQTSCWCGVPWFGCDCRARWRRAGGSALLTPRRALFVAGSRGVGRVVSTCTVVYYWSRRAGRGECRARGRVRAPGCGVRRPEEGSAGVPLRYMRFPVPDRRLE